MRNALGVLGILLVVPVSLLILWLPDPRLPRFLRRRHGELRGVPAAAANPPHYAPDQPWPLDPPVDEPRRHLERRSDLLDLLDRRLLALAHLPRRLHTPRQKEEAVTYDDYLELTGGIDSLRGDELAAAIQPGYTLLCQWYVEEDGA